MQTNGHPRIHLFGAFRIEAERAAPLRLAKARHLLTYLVVESHRTHSRDRIAELLWPGQEPGRAQVNLRQALYQLRRSLESPDPDGPVIETSRNTIRFAGGVWVDVLAFDRLLEQGRLDEAVALYEDDLLCEAADGGDAFSDWLAIARERFRRKALDAYHALVARRMEEGRHGDALHYSERSLVIDPCDETSHRHQMRLLLAQGRRNAALAQFENCRRILAEELDVAPDEETTALYSEIRNGDRKTPPAVDREDALHLGPLQRRKLQHLFRLADTDGDGRLVEDDFRSHVETFCTARGFRPGTEEYRQLLAILMEWWRAMAGFTAEDGALSLQNWFAFWSSWCASIADEAARRYSTVLDVLKRSGAVFFEAIDANGDGKLDLGEYARWLKAWNTFADPTATFEILDVDGDGALTPADVTLLLKDFFLSNDPEAAGNCLYGPYLAEAGTSGERTEAVPAPLAGAAMPGTRGP